MSLPTRNPILQSSAQLQQQQWIHQKRMFKNRRNVSEGVALCLQWHVDGDTQEGIHGVDVAIQCKETVASHDDEVQTTESNHNNDRLIQSTIPPTTTQCEAAPATAAEHSTEADITSTDIKTNRKHPKGKAKFKPTESIVEQSMREHFSRLRKLKEREEKVAERQKLQRKLEEQRKKKIQREAHERQTAHLLARDELLRRRIEALSGTSKSSNMSQGQLQTVPFIDFGNGNVHSLDGGFLTGDYLQTFNIWPDAYPNHPKRSQTHLTTRLALQNQRRYSRYPDITSSLYTHHLHNESNSHPYRPHNPHSHHTLPNSSRIYHSHPLKPETQKKKAVPILSTATHKVRYPQQDLLYNQSSSPRVLPQSNDPSKVSTLTSTDEIHSRYKSLAHEYAAFQKSK